MDLAAIHKLAAMVDSPIRGRGPNVKIRCPLAFVSHKSGFDKNPSLSVKVSTAGEKSLAICFGCGVQGTLLKVYQHAHERLGGYGAVVEYIQMADAGGLVADIEGLRIRERTGNPTTHADYTRYVFRCYGLVPKYLVDRGITQSDVQKWKIGYDDDIKRAVIPVIDEHKNVVGATRRTILPPEFEWWCRVCKRISIEPYHCCGLDMSYYPKYYDTPNLPKRDVFFGEHLVDSTRGIIHIVEGPLDAVFASRYLPNVVALLGAHTGIGQTRLSKLLRWCRSVVLLLDGDEAGQEAAEYLSEVLRPYLTVMTATLPEGSDPASLGASELLGAIRNIQYF